MIQTNRLYEFLLFFTVIINEHEEAIKFYRMMIFVLIYTDKQHYDVWEQIRMVAYGGDTSAIILRQRFRGR